MNFPWILVGLLTVVRLLAAALGHLSESESYLLVCSQHLDWGFVEGPAGVPGLLHGSQFLFGGTPLGLRWMAPFLLLVASWALWKLTLLLCHQERKVARWTVIAFNLLPLTNAAGSVMEGTMVGMTCWFVIFAGAWGLLLEDNNQYLLRKWSCFGLVLALSTQVTYLVGWLLPLVVIASLFKKHSWRNLVGAGGAILLLLISWIPLLEWNRKHDWLQWDSMTWTSFWVWPPIEKGFLSNASSLWLGALFVPLLLGIACCLKRWKISHHGPFFLLLIVPLFFCINELGHHHVPFVLLGVITSLFLPCVVETFQTSIFLKKIGIGGLCFMGLLQVVMMMQHTSLTTNTESPWNFPLAIGVTGADKMAATILALRESSLDAAGRPSFIIAQTPGLAAILGAALPLIYPEIPEAPSVFIPESPALQSQFLLWPHYADAIKISDNPDPLYVEEKEVSPFLGYNAFYITNEKIEAIPQTITSAFVSLTPWDQLLYFTRNNHSEQLFVYLCHGYQMLSL